MNSEEELIMIRETSQFYSIHQENTRKSCLQLNLIIFADFHSLTANEDKLQELVNFRDFCYGLGMRFRSKFENDTKLLNSVPVMKKTHVNNVYN